MFGRLRTRFRIRDPDRSAPALQLQRRLILEPLEERAVPAPVTPPPPLAPALVGSFQPGTFDQTFLAAAAHTDLLGFEAARIAAQRAVTPGVRDFASTQAAGFAQSFGQLAPMLSQAGVPLPSLSATDRQFLGRLATLPGRFVDMQFLQMNVRMGFQNIGLFSAASQPGAAALTAIADFSSAALSV